MMGFTVFYNRIIININNIITATNKKQEQMPQRITRVVLTTAPGTI